MPTSAAVTRLAAAAKACTAPGPVEVRARRLLHALQVRLATTTERLTVPGAPGTLIVANHISWLDIVALLAVEPVAFVTKREVTRWPFIGRTARRQGAVPVDRKSLRALPDAVAAVAERLLSGRSVAVFPEATTWCRPPGGRFRRAMFQAAIDAGAPIRPVSLSYSQGGRTSTVAAFVGDDTLARSLGRVAAASDLTVTLRARPVLLPDADRRELAAAAQRSVAGTEPAHV